MCVPYQIKNNNNKATPSDSSAGQDLSKSFLPPQPLSFRIAIKLPASARAHSPWPLYAAKANSLAGDCQHPLSSDQPPHCILITQWLAFLLGFSPACLASGCQLQQTLIASYNWRLSFLPGCSILHEPASIRKQEAAFNASQGAVIKVIFGPCVATVIWKSRGFLLPHFSICNTKLPIRLLVI